MQRLFVCWGSQLPDTDVTAGYQHVWQHTHGSCPHQRRLRHQICDLCSARSGRWRHLRVERDLGDGDARAHNVWHRDWVGNSEGTTAHWSARKSILLFHCTEFFMISSFINSWLYDPNTTILKLYVGPIPPDSDIHCVKNAQPLDLINKNSIMHTHDFIYAVVVRYWCFILRSDWSAARSATWRRLYKKLIRRWDSEREVSLRWHRTRTTKYNRLVHEFRHRSTWLCVGTWNTGLPKSVK